MPIKKSSLTVAIVAFGWLVLLLTYDQTGNARPHEDADKGQIMPGNEVYLRYCASCHGVDAQGRGIVSPALRKQPPDLTRIKVRSGGFSAAKIRGIITGEAQLPVHGQKEMPVWGGVLKDPDLNNLVKYLESIQRRLN
jgi:mono/diheme cytochrome c family protein